MKVAAGSVLDRPWGQTLGTVGMRKLTGQVTVRAEDGKTYAIAFVEGAVAAASSPLPNDSVTRVALTNHFLSPTQVGEITRQLAADKYRDEIQIVAEAARLPPAHIVTLRRRLLIQRAARTFAIERAEFEIDDELAMPTVSNFSVPLVHVIFHGARMNLSEQRLGEDLRELGSSFVLRPDVADDEIAQLEMEGDLADVIARLRQGTSLAELEASHRELEPRALQAMLYAVTCCSMVDAKGGQPVDRSAPPATRTSTASRSQPGIRIHTDQPLVTRQRTTNPSVARTLSPQRDAPAMSRTLSPQRDAPAMPQTLSPQRSTSPAASRTVTTNVTPRASFAAPPADRRTSAGTEPPAPRSTTDPPATRPTLASRTTTQPQPNRPAASARKATPTSGPFDDFKREVSTAGSNPLDEFKRESTTSRGIIMHPRTITAPRTITERDRAAREIEALIALRLSKLEGGADHFAILGVPFEAPADVVRHAFVETSRKLHPESLAQLGLQNEAKSAQRILAQVNAAFQCLSDPKRRSDYVSAVRRGEPTPVAPRARTGDLDQNELAAEAFAKGEIALKRDDIPAAVEELGRACSLAPANLEYLAMFAWAQFCAAGDKQKIYPETRKQLQHAINRLESSILPRFYLGRVERMLGHDREALNHFELVLMEEPGHREAQAELRVLQQRLAKGSKPKR